MEKNDEIITINTHFKLSTSKDYGPFWGVSLTLPVGQINNKGEYLIYKEPNNVIDDFKKHLKEISDPFPILKEKIDSLQINYHGDKSWEDAILQQYLDPKEIIYFCDHCH